MQKYDKEFYQLMNQFEKDIQQSEWFRGSVEREKKSTVPEGIYYKDGNTNDLFHSYMLGYSFRTLLTIEEQNQ